MLLESWFQAARRGDAETLQRLASRVPEDAQSYGLMTALHWAVQSRSLRAVEVLLAAGARPVSADQWARHPLHVAITAISPSSTKVPIIKALIEASASFGVMEVMDLAERQLTMLLVCGMWRPLLLCWTVARPWLLGEARCTARSCSTLAAPTQAAWFN